MNAFGSAYDGRFTLFVSNTLPINPLKKSYTFCTDPDTTLQYPVELHSTMKVKRLVSERGTNGFRHQTESTNFFDVTSSFIFPILPYEKSARVISITVQIPGKFPR